MSIYHQQHIGKVSLWDPLISVSLYVNREDKLLTSLFSNLNCPGLNFSPFSKATKCLTYFSLLTHCFQISICPLTDQRWGTILSVLDATQDQEHNLPAFLWFWGHMKACLISLKLGKLPTVK